MIFKDLYFTGAQRDTYKIDFVVQALRDLEAIFICYSLFYVLILFHVSYFSAELF